MKLVKNQIIELEITDITNEGNGVGRIENMAVFVPFTAIGDKLNIRILKVNKTYAYGKIEHMILPSPDRIQNDCPVFTKCGGCDFRHISYEAEKRSKAKFVEDAFTRIGGLSPEFLPFRALETTKRYRNKAQLPVGKKETPYCGFYARNSHRIVAIDDCLLQPSIFTEITQFVLQLVNEYKISVYNEENHQGVLRTVYLRKGNYSNEINLCLVARRKVPEFSRLARKVMSKFSDIKGVVLNINKEKTNVILGDGEILLCGQSTITDTMCENTVIISPKSFYQVNTPAAELLYQTAIDMVDLNGKTVLDLYCGAGTISLAMAHKAKKVIGVEIVEAAIENANINKALNHQDNVEFVCSDSETFVENYNGDEIDIVVVDPPRKGCSEQTLKSIVAISPDEIVMVSCNPATAARDCKILSEMGYDVKKVVGVDMFPRTKHVESVVLMSRVEK